MADVPIQNFPVQQAELTNPIATIQSGSPVAIEPEGILRLGLNTWVLAGYGGLDLTPAAGIIDATWRTITAFDQPSVSVPRYVIQDTANSGLHFEREGVWTGNLFINFSHNEGNAARKISIRMYNSTDAIAGSRVIDYYVARNQAGTTATMTILIEIDIAEIDKNWQIQVKSDDVFTSVVSEGGGWQATHAGVARLIEPTP